jgi:hypothetical protein
MPTKNNTNEVNTQTGHNNTHKHIPDYHRHHPPESEKVVGGGKPSFNCFVCSMQGLALKRQMSGAAEIRHHSGRPHRNRSHNICYPRRAIRLIASERGGLSHAATVRDDHAGRDPIAIGPTKYVTHRGKHVNVWFMTSGHTQPRQDPIAIGTTKYVPPS